MADVAETRFGLDGKVSFELSDGSLKTIDLANLGGAAGAGVTNLTVNRDSATVVVVSDTGNDAILLEATGTQAGIMSAAQAAKLASQPDTPVVSVAGKTGAVTLTGSDVGLGSVNNTPDSAKPVSTAQQAALNLKQNTLTGTADVPGLTTALAGKQATLTTYTEVPGLTVALSAKQGTLTGIADIPNLQAALDQKQGLIAAGTGKLLSPGATNGAAPVQITLGTNLSLSGNTLNATGGGSTTTIVNDLSTGGTTSALSAEMGKTLNTALAGKQASLPSNPGTILGSPTASGGNPVVVSIVDNLTSGGSTNVLSAEMGKQIQATKAGAVNASPVVPAGATSLTRTAVTTAGAEAPTGFYNRPLLSDHSITVDSTNAVAGDAIMVLNTAAGSINLVAGGVTVAIASGKAGEVAYNGTVWVDTTPATVTYTDAMARSAAVLTGALGSSTTQAPTHSSVTTALSAAVTTGAIAPSAFTTIPPSATIAAGTAVGATITVPANTLSTRGGGHLVWEVQKTGTTDAVAYSVRIGAIGGTVSTATEVGLIGLSAANPSGVFTSRIRALGSNLRVVKSGGIYEEANTTAANTLDLAINQSAGFVIYLIAVTGTTDSVNITGAHFEFAKVA